MPPVKCLKKFWKTIHAGNQTNFLGLLFVWKHSIWQTLLIDSIWFVLFHAIFVLVYEYLLDGDPIRTEVNELISYIRLMSETLSLTFLVGFFVSAVMNYWQTITNEMPTLSTVCHAIQTHFVCHPSHSPSHFPVTSMGNDLIAPQQSHLEFHQLNHTYRRDILRQLNLAWIFSFLEYCPHTKKRFKLSQNKQPSDLKKDSSSTRLISFLESASAKCFHCHRHKNECRAVPSIRQRCAKINEDPEVVKYFDGKLINEDEIFVLENLENEWLNDCASHQKSTKNSIMWIPDHSIPMQWALHNIEQSLHLGLLPNHLIQLHVFKVVNRFRNQLAKMKLFSLYKVPLVYMQLVTFATYANVLSEVFKIDEGSSANHSSHGTSSQNSTMSEGHQTVILVKKFFSLYLPLMGLLRFFILMGWFKVGVNLYNPFTKNNPYFPSTHVLNINLKNSAITIFANDKNKYPANLKISKFTTNRQQSLVKSPFEFDVNLKHNHIQRPKSPNQIYI